MKDIVNQAVDPAIAEKCRPPCEVRLLCIHARARTVALYICAGGDVALISSAVGRHAWRRFMEPPPLPYWLASQTFSVYTFPDLLGALILVVTVKLS